MIYWIKMLLAITGTLMIAIAMLSTPIAIVCVLYEWANDSEIKIALWEAFKLWVACALLILPGCGLFYLIDD